MSSGSLAIIPARGGSKRIPGKNIKSFLGKPIIAYSIEAALNSKLFDVVMVSTDDEQIAAIARSYGAEVPFMRSAENSDDFAGTTDVLLEVIQNYTDKEQQFEYGCCIYPCAPFITPLLLQQAYQQITEGALDALFPVVKYSTAVQRAFTFEGNKLGMLYPEFLNTRSQDLKAAYYDAGQFYMFNVKALQTKKRILTDNTTGIVIDDLYAQDIDSVHDWQLAEMKYKLISGLEENLNKH